MVYWMMYGKIQEHKRNGLNKSQTMRRLGIDYKTILKYWDMEPTEGFQSYVSELRFDVFLCHAWDPESKGKFDKNPVWRYDGVVSDAKASRM